MIEVKNLTKVYRPKNGAEVVALNGVNLQFADKGLVFLLGKSGSGKSTLLNLMGGLDSYTSGDIVIKGKSSADFKQSDFDSYRNTYIGFIFQEFNILEEYTVGKNIGLALELQHKPSDDLAIESILKQVDLEGYKDRKPNELSGGQKQRVAIARALIKNPEVIMGDEPTGSLDSKTGKQVFETLKKLAQDKLVVVVSHDRENAELFGDRVIELADGVVISDRIRSAEGMLKAQPISYLSEDLVRIQGGYQLTSSDVTRINSMLSSSKGEVFLSFDSGIATHIRQTKHIPQGGSTSFVPTSPANYRVKQYNVNDFKLVRSKLPLADSIKMGASGLKLKKVRLVFTIFLSFIAFLLFGFSLVASDINGAQTQMRTFSTQGGRGVFVTSEIGEKSGSNVWWSNYSATGISSSELEELEALANKPLLKIVQNKNQYGSGVSYFTFSFSSNVKKHDGHDAYYSTSMNYIVETPSAEAAGLTPAPTAGASTMPVAFNQIAITDYIADVFLEYGYQEVVVNPDTMETTFVTRTVNTYGDLIGKTLYDSSYGTVTITGVYNTGYDMSEFYYLKAPAESLGINILNRNSFENLSFGFGYVREGFTENWVSQYTYGGDTLYIGETELTIENNYGSIDHLNAYGFSKASSILSNVEWLDGYSESNFSGNDIILSPDSLYIYELDEYRTFKEQIDDFFTNYGYKKIVQLSVFGEVTTYNIAGVYNMYASQNKNVEPYLIYAHNDLYSELKTIQNIYQSLYIDRHAVGNFSVSQMHTNEVYNLRQYYQPIYGNQVYFKNGYSPVRLASNEIIVPFTVFTSYGSSTSVTWEMSKTIFDGTEGDVTCDIGRSAWTGNGYVLNSITNAGLKVVGITTGYGEVLVSEDLFNEFLSRQNDVMSVFVPLSGNFTHDRGVLEYVFNSESWDGNVGTRLKLTTSLTPLMDMLENVLSVLRLVFLYASLAFSLFAGLLLMNFIGVSISHKKKDIGVLRAIGARSKDVFSIFLCESMIIGIINFLLSVSGVVAGSIILNMLMGVVLFVPNVFPIAMMFLLCFGIASISTYFPVHKIARKKPIDAINNR